MCRGRVTSASDWTLTKSSRLAQHLVVQITYYTYCVRFAWDQDKAEQNAKGQHERSRDEEGE